MVRKLKQRYFFMFFCPFLSALGAPSRSYSEESLGTQEEGSPDGSGADSEFFEELQEEENSTEDSDGDEEDLSYEIEEEETAAAPQGENFSEAPPHYDIKDIINRGELIVALKNEQNPPGFLRMTTEGWRGLILKSHGGLQKRSAFVCVFIKRQIVMIQSSIW